MYKQSRESDNVILKELYLIMFRGIFLIMDIDFDINLLNIHHSFGTI